MGENVVAPTCGQPAVTEVITQNMVAPALVNPAVATPAPVFTGNDAVQLSIATAPVIAETVTENIVAPAHLQQTCEELAVTGTCLQPAVGKCLASAPLFSYPQPTRIQPAITEVVTETILVPVATETITHEGTIPIYAQPAAAGIITDNIVTETEGGYGGCPATAKDTESVEVTEIVGHEIVGDGMTCTAPTMWTCLCNAFSPPAQDIIRYGT